jgi:hypothetical protein
VDIKVYVDFDWAWDIDRRISINIYVFWSFGGVVSWMRKWKDVVSFSTVDSECMETTHACKEVI